MKKLATLIAVAGLFAAGSVYAGAEKAAGAASKATRAVRGAEGATSAIGAGAKSTKSAIGAARVAEGAAAATAKSPQAKRAGKIDVLAADVNVDLNKLLSCEIPPTVDTWTKSMAARAVALGLSGNGCVSGKFKKDPNVFALSLTLQAVIADSASRNGVNSVQDLNPTKANAIINDVSEAAVRPGRLDSLTKEQFRAVNLKGLCENNCDLMKPALCKYI